MMLPETRSGLQISLDLGRIEISPTARRYLPRLERDKLLLLLIILGVIGIALLLAAYANRQIKKGKKGWV